MIKKIFFYIILLLLIITILTPVVEIGFGKNYSNSILNDQSAKETLELSQHIVFAIQNKNKTELEKFYSPYINESNINQLLDDYNKYFLDRSPISVKLIGLSVVKSFSAPKKIETNATLEYQFLGGHWYLINLVYQTQNGDTQLLGFHEAALPDSLEKINKVDFSKTSAKQFSFLFLSILIPSIVLTAFIFCVRTKNLKRKWLWILFILFGVAGIQFNWTTQEVISHIFKIQLFSSQLIHPSIFAPLIIEISIPLGAIIFFIKILLREKMGNRKITGS